MKRSMISFIIAMVLAAAPVFGHSRPPVNGDVSIEIVSDNGDAFRFIPYQDFRLGATRVVKSYLEAKKERNYGIVLRNNSAERVGVVIAVDGRNIISGKRSDLAGSERMYLLNAYAEGRFDGWRTSDTEVHRFFFTEPADSYSVRTFSDSSAMGVIAVAVFREKELRGESGQLLRKDAPAAPSTRSSEKTLSDDRAGTGFGDSRYSPVVTVPFKPERLPFRKMLVKYEWTETLCRSGILACGREHRNRLWDGDGYAPAPPER